MTGIATWENYLLKSQKLDCFRGLDGLCSAGKAMARLLAYCYLNQDVTCPCTCLRQIDWYTEGSYSDIATFEGKELIAGVEFSVYSKRKTIISAQGTKI